MALIHLKKRDQKVLLYVFMQVDIKIETDARERQHC